MGRVINPDGIGKERTRLTREIVLALRELMRQTSTDETTRDLAAFISLALAEVYETVDVSVSAWEKRGYWVKADRFRMDWAWTERLSNTLRTAVLADDWPTVALSSAQVAERLKSVEIPQRHKLGAPWEGALKKIKQKA